MKRLVAGSSCGPHAGGWLLWTRRGDGSLLRVSVNHQDLETHPVHARVWADRRLVLDTTLTTTAPIVRFVELPMGQRRIVIETDVDRTVWPRDLGADDQRELGLLVGWRFVDRPSGDPPGRP